MAITSGSVRETVLGFESGDALHMRSGKAAKATAA
jgi:hypothetical protein